MIYRLRTEEKLSQARFAEIMGVSAQAVQKWESGVSVPELDKLIKIAHRFGVSLDSLALDRDMRAEEELPAEKYTCRFPFQDTRPTLPYCLPNTVSAQTKAWT